MFTINLRGRVEVRVGRHNEKGNSDTDGNVADAVAMVVSTSPLFSSSTMNLSPSVIHALMYSITHHTSSEYQVIQYQILDPENTKMNKIGSNLSLEEVHHLMWQQEN